MVREIIIRKLRCVSVDINAALGLLYIACSVLAYWEIYHPRGMKFIDFLIFNSILISLSSPVGS